MESVQKKTPEIEREKETNVAPAIVTCISVIAFVFMILVVALPAIYKINSEKAEKAALKRLEIVSNDITDKEIAAPSSDNISIQEEGDLSDADPVDFSVSGLNDSKISNVIPGPDNTLSLVFTIQAGSFKDLHSALKLYDSMMNDLNEKDLAYLRIEKVGKYYAVRIGKFGDQRHIKNFHEKIRPHLSSARIMKAYIKKDRIKKLHSS
ncbi:MAG: SPOR domain-containing protein [Nitrospiraceae bacterium]|nr:MAG: SPOR domain-containing protein [Nitrospiraceae bacterium]